MHVSQVPPSLVKIVIVYWSTLSLSMNPSTLISPSPLTENRSMAGNTS